MFDLGVLARSGLQFGWGGCQRFVLDSNHRCKNFVQPTSDTVIDDGVTDDTWSPEKPYVSLDLGVAFAPPDSGMTLADLHGIEFGKGSGSIQY